MTDVSSVSGTTFRCVSGVGAGVGDWLGAAVGICDGAGVGAGVGDWLGAAVGIGDGAGLGIAVGYGVAVVGAGVGAGLGEKVVTLTELTVVSAIESRRPSASAAK